MNDKFCRECKEKKSLEYFHINKCSPDGYHSKCKQCKNKRSREYYSLNKKKILSAQREKYITKSKKPAVYSSQTEGNLMRRYGITLEQYNNLLEKQDYKCAICLKPQKEEKRRFAVDHDHVTNEIRGLLCNYCNHRIVGRHRDSALLLRVVNYLEQGTGLYVPRDNKYRRRKRKKKN